MTSLFAADIHMQPVDVACKSACLACHLFSAGAFLGTCQDPRGTNPSMVHAGSELLVSI